MTYFEAQKEAVRGFEAAGLDNAAYDAAALLEFVTGYDRSALEMHRGEDMLPEQLEAYEELCAEREDHVPLQHLLGEAWFMGLPFMVNEDVLIPRQDTEILVEQVLADLPADRENLRALDLCTGTGCIPVSLIRLGGLEQVDAGDISEDALFVAMQNSMKNGTIGKLFLTESDLGEAFEKGVYDILTSNPPYIPTKTIETLMPEVRDHDPWLALDGGEDGLDFYKRLAVEGAKLLKAGGRIYLEIGEEQASDVGALLAAQGFEQIQVVKDLAGLDRVVKAVRKDKDV